MQEAGHVRHVLARNGVDLARNLRRLCDNKTQKDGVMAGGGHLALIALLYAGADAVATEHALRALVKLSFQVAASSASLVQAGAADPTVALLRTAPTPSNKTVVKNAAILVCNLAKVSAGKEAFQKAGAIAPLVSLLSTTPRIAKSAADALRNLSYPQTTNCAEIVEAGAILPLVALLHGEAANSAVAALRNLANDAAGAAAIHSAGGVVPLVALLHAAEAETAWRAADALTIMAMNSEQSRPAILAALAARPPPSLPNDDLPTTAVRAADALTIMDMNSKQSRPAILAALTARPPPPPPNDDQPTLGALLKLLQYSLRFVPP